MGHHGLKQTSNQARLTHITSEKERDKSDTRLQQQLIFNKEFCAASRVTYVPQILEEFEGYDGYLSVFPGRINSHLMVIQDIFPPAYAALITCKGRANARPQDNWSKQCSSDSAEMLDLGSVACLGYREPLNSYSEPLLTLIGQRTHTIRREAVAKRTDAMMFGPGYSSGVHMFKVTWRAEEYGSHAGIGVGNKYASTTAATYTNLVGSTPSSSGWNLKSNTKTSFLPDPDATFESTYPKAGGLMHTNQPFDVERDRVKNFNSDSFYLILDCENRRLSFADTYKGAFRWLGWCQMKLPVGALYPMVSTVWGNCLVNMQHVSCILAAKTLASACISAISRNTTDLLKLKDQLEFTSPKIRDAVLENLIPTDALYRPDQVLENHLINLATTCDLSVAAKCRRLPKQCIRWAAQTATKKLRLFKRAFRSCTSWQK